MLGQSSIKKVISPSGHGDLNLEREAGSLGNGLKAWTGGRLRRDGKLRIGVVAKGTPFWEWLIPRLGIHAWTWKAGSKESLGDKLERELVDVVLFDKVVPQTSSPVWNSPRVKCVMWEEWG
eukprot:scaffold10756_cov62-Attheya_sp.AAC.2